VPEYLTGYRYLPISMSADIPKMLRGRDIVAAEICQDIRRGQSTSKAIASITSRTISLRTACKHDRPDTRYWPPRMR
jgi:hypothetical protein